MLDPGAEYKSSFSLGGVAGRSAVSLLNDKLRAMKMVVVLSKICDPKRVWLAGIYNRHFPNHCSGYCPPKTKKD